jgi:hypothetical protein
MAIIYGKADSEKSLLKKLPGEVRHFDDMDRVKKDFENKIKQVDDGFFSGLKRWNYKRQVKKFDKARENPLHPGTKGEINVIEELEKLDDTFHILCGVRIQLPRYVTYNKRRNLKSAQMDFVVVSTKGVYMIEVKNWSNQFANDNNNGFSPYEQTERAGRVLWISLQDWIGDIRVTNILLSIKGNLPYNKNYRSVFVSSLYGINKFLEKRQDILSEKEVQKTVKFLKSVVTK